MKNWQFAVLAVFLLSISACTVGPDHAPRTAADLGVPDSYIRGENHETAHDISAWWTGFNDPVLTELITRSHAANPDLAQSIARVAQARESLAQRRGAALPQIEVTGRDGRNINSDAPDRWSLSRSIDARWTIDVFGEQKRSVEAERASFEAEGLSFAHARSLLAAEVARNYIDMRSGRIKLAVAQASLDVQDQNVQIAGWRAQAGLVSSIDVQQAQAQRAQTAATLPLLEQAEAQARYRLSVLTGSPPGAVDELISGDFALPLPPPEAAAGTPAALLRRRPDVRSAERDLAAATARIGVAEARLYPALSLSGTVGTSSSSISGLLDLITGSLFSNLTAVIFDGGQRKSAVRSQQAATEGTLAAYRSVILGALEDVENAMIARASADQRISALQEQLTAANNSALLARINYRAGLTDFRTLLESERSLLEANDGLASAKGDQLNAIIQLYLALGGGWNPLDYPGVGDN